MPLLTLVALVLALLAASAAGDAQPTNRLAAPTSPRFAPLSPIAHVVSDGWLGEIGVADVTGDGAPDIVGVHGEDAQTTHPLVVLAGNGNGGFKDVTAQVFVGAVARTQHPRVLLFADFNGDGRPDFFIADTGNDNPPYAGWRNTLVLSAPGGKLVDASASLPAESGYTHAAAAGDVNHDGVPDLYVGNLCCGSAPGILINDGHGHFSRLQNALPDGMSDVFNGPRYTAAAFADVNGDGWDDLILAAEDHTPSNAVLINDKHGHFVPLPGALPPKPFGPDAIGLAVAPVDLNGDHNVDLVIAYTKGSPFYVGRWIQVLINKGDGTFRDETATRLPQTANDSEWPYALRVADLNGDGKPDLAVALNPFGLDEPPPIYLNRGNGRFKPLYLASSPYAMLDLADANRDGRLDIVSAESGQSGSDTYAVNLQKKPPKPKRKCVKRPHHPCHK